MSQEVLSAQQSADPMPFNNIGQHAEWASSAALRQQTAFFKDCFAETVHQDFTGRHFRGPYYEETAAFLKTIDEKTKRIDPRLKAEHLMSLSYQSPQARAFVEDLDNAQNLGILCLRQERQEGFYEMGERRAQEARGTTLEEGLLDEPPYYRQEWTATSQQACFNACFRMVFGGITQKYVHENTVYQAMTETLNSHLAHDQTYLQVFSTPRFKRLFPEASVQTHTTTGADLRTVGDMARKLKARNAALKIFSIVNLNSETAEASDVWHTNILLGATESEVIVHDPSPEKGKSSRHIDKTKFYQRWAMAQNRAHLIIAA